MSGSGACPACGGPLHAWRSVRPADPALGSRPVRLSRCGRCGSAVTVDPLPPMSYEVGAYQPRIPRLHSLARPMLDVFDRQRLAFLRPHVPPGGQLLDVGAGRGRFVIAAQAAGYRAWGIEPSSHGLAQAGLVRASVQEAEVPAGSLDAITMWHVLEHLDDPGAALARVRPWLGPRGVLLIGVPNLDSLQARLGGGRWYHLDVPRHRIHFTPAGLESLLAGEGFAVRRTHHLLAEHNPFGMWQSLLNRITRRPDYLYNLLKRNASAASPDLALSLAALPLAPLAGLVELTAAAARRGGTIAVVAQPER